MPVAAWGALRDAGFVILSTRVAEASTSSAGATSFCFSPRPAANFCETATAQLTLCWRYAGDTTKLRIEMGDGKSVEAVIMRHDPRNGTYGGDGLLG